MSSLYKGAALGVGLTSIPWILKYPFDFVIFSLLILHKNKRGVQYLIEIYFDKTIAFNVASTATCVTLVYQVLRYVNGIQGPSTSTDEFPAKPMIFRCATSHTRISPKKHSFNYSYLLVGVPVGWKGSVGGMLSADDERENSSWLWAKPGKAWHVVNGDDYLGRGHSADGLRGKLRDYLKSQVCSCKCLSK